MFEDSISLLEVLPRIKKSLSLKIVLEVLVGLGGLSMIFYGFWHVVVKSNQDLSCMLPETPSAPFTKPIVVSVAGAVERPGIVSVPPGSRLGEVVEKVGGFEAEADLAFLNRELNLSQVVADQQHVFIPFKTENNPDLVEKEIVEPDSDGISINTASNAELDSLPGIGPKRAEAIIAGRPYQSVNDLLEKEVLSQSLFDQISSDLRL